MWLVKNFAVGRPFFSSFHVRAQTLWRKSTYGMTPGQVKSVFPEAQQPSNPRTLYAGEVELLRLSDVEIVGHQFLAAFYFMDDKLTQVTLSLAGNETSHGAELVFESLTEILRAKYGSEITKETKHEVMHTRTSRWLNGKTNITLYYNDIGDYSPVLNLLYQVRISSEAGKI